LEGRSTECYLVDDMDASVDALRQAIALRRAAADLAGEAVALSQLARRQWCGGHSADALHTARAAVDLLEGRPPGPELALTASVLGSVYLNDEWFDETVEGATRALDRAEACDATEVAVYCLNNLGTMRLLAGMPEGRAQ